MGMGKPEISIVVPMYNSSRFVEACIDSILAQDFRDFELILIDDNSTDNTIAICQRYLQDERVSLLVNNKGKGVSSARNLGISNSRGGYITFIDSDDIVAKSFLSELINVAKSHPDYLAMCSYCTFSESEPNFDMSISSGLTEISSDVLLANIFYYHSSGWGCLFRKDLIDIYDIRMEESASFNEDIYFTCKYISICKGGMNSCNKFYGYRINPDGIGANKRHSDLTETDVIHRSRGYLAFQDALNFCKRNAPENYKFIDIGYSFIAAEVMLTAARAKIRDFELKKDIKKHLSFSYCLRYLRKSNNIFQKLLVVGIAVSPTAVKCILDIFDLLKRLRRKEPIFS